MIGQLMCLGQDEVMHYLRPYHLGIVYVLHNYV